MTANPCHGPNPDTSAARDLAFLQAAGAVRRYETDGDGFVLELRGGRLLALPAESIATFKAGVLCGWRLPHSEASG